MALKMNILVKVTIFEMFITLFWSFLLLKRPVLFGSISVVGFAFVFNVLNQNFALGPFNSYDPLPYAGKEYMKAAVFTPELGVNHDVSFDDHVPVPRFTDNQVFVKIEAAGLNPSNYKVNFGAFPFIRYFKKFISGYDFSGKILAVGNSPECSHLKQGDEVYGITLGSIAEFSSPPCSKTYLKPKNLDFIEAASTPVTALTTLEVFSRAGYKEKSDLTKDKTVLIVGGSGGCGMYGIKLAKAFGFKTIVSINSKRNQQVVRDLGADLSIDYNNSNEFDSFLKENQQKFDFIYDTVSSFDPVDPNYFPQLFPLLKAEQKGEEILPKYIAINGYISDFILEITQNVLKSFGYQVKFGNKQYEMMLSPPNKDDMKKLKELFEDGSLGKTIVIEKVYNLNSKLDVFNAFQRMKSRRTVGKIVFKI